MSQAMSSIQCRNPRQGESFRVHAGPERERCMPMVRDPDTGELHVVDVTPWTKVPKAFLACLRVCINSEGTRFLWCIEITDGVREARTLEAEWTLACMAEDFWYETVLVPSSGACVIADSCVFPAPVWGTFDFENLVREAFAGRIIESLNHPLIAKLGGLV